MGKNIVRLIIALALPLAVGFVGSLFTRPEIDGWYATLNKPEWNPPNWLFGPVWTVLYTLMGISIYLIWKSPAPASKKRNITVLFLVQLALNLAWSYIFFHQHQIASAFFEIIFLWFFILFTIFSMPKVSKIAALLMVPYLLWVTFAAILNYHLWELNA